jgi:hypothetical protein
MPIDTDSFTVSSETPGIATFEWTGPRPGEIPANHSWVKGAGWYYVDVEPIDSLPRGHTPIMTGNPIGPFQTQQVAQTAASFREGAERIDPFTVYTFHTDPGHGWLEVPRSHLRILGIEDRISGYSYADDENVYLEEDCDASLFAKYFRDRFGDWPLHRDIYADPSPVRKYRQYV